MRAILVTYTSGTYHAKLHGQTKPDASRTSGPDHAAQALVEKLPAGDPAKLKRVERDDRRLDTLGVPLDQRQAAERLYILPGGTTDAVAAQAPAVEPDPAFEVARRHAEALTSGVKITVGAAVALGMELNHLKKELGYVRGGDRRSKSTNLTLIPWKERVTSQTGFSYQRCQDFMKTASAVVETVSRSRAKALADIKFLVKSPPSEWQSGDYSDFADAIGDHFDAGSFRDLMIEVGVLHLPEPAGDDEDNGEQDDDQQEFPFAAMIDAQDCIGQPILGLHMTQQNPENFTRHLYNLPLDDQDEDEAAGVPRITGLRTLQHILTQAQSQIAQAIKDKAA